MVERGRADMKLRFVENHAFRQRPWRHIDATKGISAVKFRRIRNPVVAELGDGKHDVRFLVGHQVP